DALMSIMHEGGIWAPRRALYLPSGTDTVALSAIAQPSPACVLVRGLSIPFTHWWCTKSDG
ncbi:hypothetical protein RA989_13290, partial [Mycobacteroides abscessus subsp. massiliense]